MYLTTKDSSAMMIVRIELAYDNSKTNQSLSHWQMEQKDPRSPSRHKTNLRERTPRKNQSAHSTIRRRETVSL